MITQKIPMSFSRLSRFPPWHLRVFVGCDFCVVFWEGEAVRLFCFSYVTLKAR